MGGWFDENVDPDWMKLRQRLMGLLQDEAELEEIVKLVGMDALSAPDRLKLEAARSIREDFLHQDAFHEIDTYTPLHKQDIMMRLVLDYYDEATVALGEGIAIDDLVALPARERIGRFKYTPIENVDAAYEETRRALAKEIADLHQKEDF